MFLKDANSLYLYVLVLTLMQTRIHNLFLKFSIVLRENKYCKSSRPDVFCEKGVLRNYAKFTGKHVCQSLFFNKVAGGACNFLKKETLTHVFSCEFCEISKNTFFYRTPLVLLILGKVAVFPSNRFFYFNITQFD